MRILILALSGIGDALMFTPSIKLLRSVYPEGEIDVLVMFKGVKDIYDRNKYVNNVIYFDFMKEGALSSLRFLLSLRKKYNISINVYPANRKEYNIINFLIGASKRGAVKYIRKDAANLGYLNNVRIDENDKQHNVITNIKLISKLSGENFKEQPQLDFPLTDEDNRFAETFCAEHNIGQNSVVIGFHPGSATLKNHIHRRWEPQKFAELGRILINEQNAKILIFGGPEELQLKNLIKQQIDSENAIAVNSGNLAQSAALMKKCSVFVSNDSSLMHVASAMMIKVVAILGPTNPFYIHPWKTEHKIVRLDLDCSPCFFYSPRPLICFRNDVKYKCIKELDVDLVLKHVKDYL